MTPLQAVILAAWLVTDGILVLILLGAVLDAIRATVKSRRNQR